MGRGEADKRGVLRHDNEKAFQGYTLFCETATGSTPDGRPAWPIYLIDMDGRIAHEWRVAASLQSYCRLLPDGNLIYPTHDRSDISRPNIGLHEIEPDGREVWHYHCRADHDFQILDSGHFLINTITESMCPALGPELKRHPYIIEVARAKELVWEWRGQEHLDELRELLPASGWRHVMDRAGGRFAFDWAHNNTVQVIGANATYEKELAAGGTPRFRPGNFFISYRSNDVIAVVDRDSGRIVWAWGPGELDGQHKPHMLANGNVLIFDNGTLRKFSRVIELDPLTGRIEWEYTGRADDSFYSAAISSAQRLDNGNTLICDGGNARLFEVTPQGQIVWEFVNPYRTQGARPVIYRCLRYSPDYVRPLLDRIKR